MHYKIVFNWHQNYIKERLKYTNPDLFLSHFFSKRDYKQNIFPTRCTSFEYDKGNQIRSTPMACLVALKPVRFHSKMVPKENKGQFPFLRRKKMFVVISGQNKFQAETHSFENCGLHPSPRWGSPRHFRLYRPLPPTRHSGLKGMSAPHSTSEHTMFFGARRAATRRRGGVATGDACGHPAASPLFRSRCVAPLLLQ